MNNYELATDEFCFMYKRYKKTMPWKHFKRKSWVIQQNFCERWDMKITGHRTRIESYIYYFDKIISILKKYAVKVIKSKGGKPVQIFPKSRQKKLKIHPSKGPTSMKDFDRINDKLFGKKRKVW